MIEAVKEQGVEAEEDIVFEDILNGKTVKENKNQWNLLKKRVSSRGSGSKSVPEILESLESSFSGSNGTGINRIKNKRRPKHERIAGDDVNAARGVNTSVNELLNRYNEYLNLIG